METLIEAKNLTLRFSAPTDKKGSLKKWVLDAIRRQVRHKGFLAVDDVSFSIQRGEAVGLVGRNGAGKSTLLKLVTGIANPTSGSIAVSGQVAPLLALGNGLDPTLTGRENIYLNGAILGYEKAWLRAHEADIIDFSELGDFIDAPVRTYYRDAYWTVLCLYKRRPDLIRCQILTLAHGIEKNGDCPSSVTFEFRPRLRNYYDSPCFFVMLVYDYINHTGDRSILDEYVNGKSVYDLCLLAVDRLTEFEDKTGLIVKAGRYNRRDWSDQINRTGYVTYVELLYTRALFCLSRIVGTRDENRARRYREMSERTKDAINAILWDEEKGYYINYKSGDFVEDNLSVDTILAVLFGVSDKSRTARLLDNFSRLLDTRNNRFLRAGNFGLTCVYPCYRGVDRCFSRSVQPFAYQNGASWPCWSALVAYAQMKNGREYTYALTSSFLRNVKEGRYTPVEYDSPLGDPGSPLHARSSAVAWVYDWQDTDFFENNEEVWKRSP